MVEELQLNPKRNILEIKFRYGNKKIQFQKAFMWASECTSLRGKAELEKRISP